MIGVGDAFWGMTMREFTLALDGYNDRQQSWRRLVGWAIVNLMNMWSKRKITLQKILKEKGGRPRELANAAVANEYFRAENERLQLDRERKEKQLEKMTRYGT